MTDLKDVSTKRLAEELRKRGCLRDVRAEAGRKVRMAAAYRALVYVGDAASKYARVTEKAMPDVWSTTAELTVFNAEGFDDGA